MAEFDNIIYNITDNGDNSFTFEANDYPRFIQKLQVSSVIPYNEKSVVITMENKEQIYIWNWQNEESLGATSAQDLADKINTIVNNTSGGGSFTCTDVGSCINNATAGTPTAAGVIPFYESGLKKVTFTNFFNALKAGFDFFYGSLSVQNTLVAAMSKCIPFNPGFDSVKTVINIPHGLAGTPTFYSVAFTKGVETDAALANYTIAVDATNVTVTFVTPPQSPTPFGPTLIMLIVKL